MTGITSAEDVRRIFPGALIDDKEFHLDVGPMIHAFSDSRHTSIGGLLTWEQVEALMYWRAHMDEFKTDPMGNKPKKLTVVRCLEDVSTAFQGSGGIYRTEIDTGYCYAKRVMKNGVELEGSFSALQVKAIDYWLANPDQFPDARPYLPPA